MKSIISILFFLFSFSLYSQNWINYTNDRDVNALLKDADTMWVATDGGLIKYTISTGTRQEYNKANSNIPHNKVYDIKKNALGQLFIATARGVAVFSGNQFTFINGPGAALSPYSATSLFFDNANNMWVGSANSTFMYNGTSWITHNQFSTFPSGNIEDFIEDVNNAIFIATYSGVYKLIGTTWQLCSSNFQISLTREFTKKTDGTLLVAANSGVFEYNGTTWTRISTVNANSIALTNSNVPYVATSNGLVILYKNSTTTYNSLNSPITVSNLQKIISDPVSDYLWMGATNNLYNEKGTGFYTYLKPSYNFLSNREDVFCVNKKNNTKWIGYCTTGNSYGISKIDNADNVTNYTTANSNLPAGLNFLSMATDTNGVLYIGTYSGLLVFNGSTFNLLSTSNSALSNNTIYNISLKKQTNTLYLSHDAGFSTYKLGVFTNTTAASIGFLGTTVYDIAIDKNGVIWAGALDKIAKYNGSTWQLFNYQNTTLPNSYVLSLSTDTAANVWIGWGDAGISKLSAGIATNYNVSNSTIKKNDIKQVQCDNLNNVWVSYSSSPTALGVSLLNTSAIWNHYNTTNGLTNNYINRMDVDGRNSIWIATDNGITTFEKQYWNSYSGTSDNELNYNYVTDLEIDKNSNVIIGTRSDISTLNTNGTWSFTTTGATGGAEIYSVTKDRTGKLYAGILSGLLEFNSTTPTGYTTPNPAKDIAVDTLNNKWIPSNFSVYKYNSGVFTPYNKSITPGFNGYILNCVSVNSSNEVWIGTQDSGVNVFNGATWINFNRSNYGIAGFTGTNSISEIAFDKIGNTWLASSNGLLKYNGVNFTYYNYLNSTIPNKGIYTMDVDTNNNVWCGYSNGVYMFDGINTTVYDSTNSPLIPVTYRTLKVNKHNVVFVGGYNDELAGGGAGLYAFYPNGITVPTKINEGTENKLGGFSVYPNPTSNNINISFKQNNLINFSIEIFNSLGEKMYLKNDVTNSETIDLSKYMSGIYMITIKNNSGMWSQKIVKY